MSDTEVQTEDIINFLKSELSFREVYQQILTQRIIAKYAEEKSITVSEAEIQAEANQQRRKLRLEKASDTLNWLSQQMITPADWEVGIRNRLLAQKLAESMFAQDVERFFNQNRLEFEQVVLYQMIVADDKLAQELYYQIEEGETSFYDAAHQYDIDSTRRQKCGYEGVLYRWAIAPDIATLVFSSIPQQLIGPIKTEQGYHLLIVEEKIPAELTPQRYQEILQQMFKQWLNTQIESLLSQS